jgi:fumarylacetoacetate (FAA) hydrolase family protein
MSEDREIRQLLENTQAENRDLKRRIATVDELEAQLEDAADQLDALTQQLAEARAVLAARAASARERVLLSRVRSLEDTLEHTRTQLELADEARDASHRDATRLRRELELSKQEQVRLRSLLENERLERKLAKRR